VPQRESLNRAGRHAASTTAAQERYFRYKASASGPIGLSYFARFRILINETAIGSSNSLARRFSRFRRSTKARATRCSV